MNKEEKNKIKQNIAGLLEDSIIDEDIKNVLRENVENFNDEELIALNDSLEKEKVELEKAIKKINEAGKEGDIAWDNLKREQAAVADEMVNQTINEIVGNEKSS